MHAPVVRHITAARKDMDTCKDGGGHCRLNSGLDLGNDMLFSIEAPFPALHFSAEIGSHVEPITIVRSVQIMQAVDQTTKGIFVDGNLLFGL